MFLELFVELMYLWYPLTLFLSYI